jgi:hypothetical protein
LTTAFSTLPLEERDATANDTDLGGLPRRSMGDGKRTH